MVGKNREVIDVDDVIQKGAVGDVDTEKTKTKWSIALAVISLVVATGMLTYSVSADDSELKTWSMNLISSIAGAAIAYGFSTRSN